MKKLTSSTALQAPSLTLIRSALIAAGLIASLSIGTAYAADTPAPEAHSNSVGAAISDTAITAKVKAKLMEEDALKQSHIKVTTTNGVVTLKGTANTSDAKDMAENDTKAVDGVKSVDNSLKVATSSPTMAKAEEAADKTKRVVSDSWITTKVKSEILADSVSKGFDVNVKTKHGVVMLKGSLGNQDAIDHVKDIAEKVNGVKSVDTSALIVASK